MMSNLAERKDTVEFVESTDSNEDDNFYVYNSKKKKKKASKLYNFSTQHQLLNSIKDPDMLALYSYALEAAGQGKNQQTTSTCPSSSYASSSASNEAIHSESSSGAPSLDNIQSSDGKVMDARQPGSNTSYCMNIHSNQPYLNAYTSTNLALIQSSQIHSDKQIPLFLHNGVDFRSVYQFSSNVPNSLPPLQPIPLRLILVSGKTKDFNFSPTQSASDIAKYLFKHWPEEWSEEERVSSADTLRLIYQGRFLHGNITLSALHLPSDRSTVMHLVARERITDHAAQEVEKKIKSMSRIKRIWTSLFFCSSCFSSCNNSSSSTSNRGSTERTNHPDQQQVQSRNLTTDNGQMTRNSPSDNSSLNPSPPSSSPSRYFCLSQSMKASFSACFSGDSDVTLQESGRNSADDSNGSHGDIHSQRDTNDTATSTIPYSEENTTVVANATPFHPRRRSSVQAGTSNTTSNDTTVVRHQPTILPPSSIRKHHQLVMSKPGQSGSSQQPFGRGIRNNRKKSTPPHLVEGCAAVRSGAALVGGYSTPTEISVAKVGSSSSSSRRSSNVAAVAV